MDVNESRIAQLEAELVSKDATIAILLGNISDMEEELEAVDNVIEMYYMMFVQIQNDINWQNQTRDLSNANLNDADLTSVYWYNTICPDGTNSDDNGDTCANNLI